MAEQYGPDTPRVPDSPVTLITGLAIEERETSMHGEAAPRAGTGTVFVRELGDGEFTAIWQGGDDHPQAYVDVEGSRREVLAWVSRCRPATFLAFDRSRDEYVPFTVANGTVDGVPF